MFGGGGTGFFPVFRGDLVDRVIGISWEAGEHVVKVSQGIDAPAAAGFHDGIEDGGLFSGFGRPDKEPVLFADSRGPDRVFDKVVVYALKGVIGIRVQIPAGDIAPARSTGSGSGGNK